MEFDQLLNLIIWIIVIAMFTGGTFLLGITYSRERTIGYYVRGLSAVILAWWLIVLGTIESVKLFSCMLTPLFRAIF